MTRTSLSPLTLLCLSLAACSADAQTGWTLAQENGQCLVAAPPTADHPTFVSIGAADQGNVMILLASPYLASLSPDHLYPAEFKLESGPVASMAMTQTQADDVKVFGLIYPYDQLEAFAASGEVEVRVDGRRLVTVSPEGRKDAVSQLKSCLASAPATRQTGHLPSAAKDDPLAAAEAAGLAASGHIPRAQTDAGANDPLAAAEAAGLAAIQQGGGIAPTPANPAMGTGPSTDEFMMMFRMNNYLIGGGNMADTQMGNAMWGLE